MDDKRVRRMLARLAGELGDRVILWRGASPSGSDIDLLVLSGARDQLADVLSREGLEPGRDGHWAAADGAIVVDPIDEDHWPDAYPSVAGVAARAESAPDSPRVASAADRVLIFAAEAVAGRPVVKLLPKIRALVAHHEAVEDALTLGATEGALSLARLAADPERMERAQVRGALGYPAAIAAGIRSRRGRAALRMRFAATAARRLRRLRGGGRPARPQAA